jgi:phosphate transport system permease protein
MSNGPDLSAYIEEKYPKRKLKNRIMCCFLGLAALTALAPLLSIFALILKEGLPALSLDFFTKLPQPVGELGGGMANAILGTATLILLASLIGVPWGILTGLYLSEYRHQKRWIPFVRFCADMLSSIPSIIIGLFVYAVVVIPMKRFSAIAGGIALGLLMIPIIARSVEELLKLVPHHIREAGLALGLPRWKVILHIVLTGSSKAITTGIMLSVARVAGETAPLLFTAFGNRYWQSSLDQPISSLPVQIYNYAISPYDDWHHQAWAEALILVFFVFTLNLATRYRLSPNRRESP